jgi:hypothetical protein
MYLGLRETSSGALVIFNECPGRISNGILFERKSSEVSCSECVCVCIRTYVCMCMRVCLSQYVRMCLCVCVHV